MIVPTAAVTVIASASIDEFIIAASGKRTIDAAVCAMAAEDDRVIDAFAVLLTWLPSTR